MKLLTVAVPAYNVEQYIEKCLGSFVCAYERDEVEVIVVNDGSTDSTEALALNFAAKYPGMFRVITKENGGHGSGINTGIRYASGRYFKVVDGDDWVDSSSFIAYLDILSGTDADMVITDFCCVSSESMRITERRSTVIDGSDLRGLMVFDDVADSLLVRMHSATWRTALLRDNNIVIDEHSYYVDMEYNTFPIPYVNSVMISNLPVYMYRLGLGGQSVSLASLRKNMVSHENVLRKLLAFIDESDTSGVSQPKLRYLCRMAAEMATMQMQIYLSFPLNAGMFASAAAFDRSLRIESAGVYDAITNKAVRLLRRTKYLLFPAASLMVRLTKK